jgi:cytochrome P450
MSKTSAPGCPVFHGIPFDILDPRQAGDPSPWLDQAQREAPVFYMPERDLWCVTRYDDVLAVIKDTETFSSANVIPLAHVTDDLAAAFGDQIGDRPLVTLDPPEHTRLRKAAQRGFTPKIIGAKAEIVRELCDALIDDFIGDGRCDVVGQLAEHLPVQAITALVGAPLERAPQFFQWAQDRVAALVGAPALDDRQRAALVERAVGFNAWLVDFVESRRAAPQEDLTSELVQATDNAGEPALSTADVVSLIATILSAGSSTTTNFIPVAIGELLRHPDQWEELRADRSLIPNAVEECLRLRTSVRGVNRRTTREVELGGVTIPAGADVYVHYTAAQRDASVFQDPGRFDIHRANVRRQFAFGRWTHMCLGAPLARLETQVVIEQFLDRLPGLRLVHGQTEEWVPHVLTPGLRALQLEWDPPR